MTIYTFQGADLLCSQMHIFNSTVYFQACLDIPGLDLDDYGNDRDNDGNRRSNGNV